jgi:hypothetical protein
MMAIEDNKGNNSEAILEEVMLVKIEKTLEGN